MNLFFLSWVQEKMKKSLSQQSHTSISDKKGTLRAVRNFMKIGRSRHTSKEREVDSSTEDEGR